MKKILVTGHRGFIGSKLFRHLKSKNYYVLGIDLKDGNDILHCLPNEDFDYVFHMSAIPRVTYTVEKPSYTMKQNVYITSVLLEWCKLHKVKRFIFSSSSAVYGNGDMIPTSPYGMQKLFSEIECKLYYKLYNLDTVCLRYFNVYSEEQEYGGSYSTAICAWMHMLKKGEPLRIDGDGEQTRDQIHVDDIVSANQFCMEYSGDFCGKCLDVGSGKSVSLNYLKSFIDKHFNVNWKYAPQRKGDVRHTNANIKELQSLGWNPKVSIDEGLKRCFIKE